MLTYTLRKLSYAHIPQGLVWDDGNMFTQGLMLRTLAMQ